MTAEDWTRLSAIATAAMALIAAAAVVVAVCQLRVQARITRYATAFDSLWRLDDRWDSPEIQRVRRAAATAIMENREAVDVEGVLDFFELVALLVKNDVVEDMLVWHEFYHYLSNYWPLTREYVERVRRENPVLYENVVDLVPRLDAIEAARRRRTVAEITPSREALNEFLEDELHAGLTA